MRRRIIVASAAVALLAAVCAPANGRQFDAAKDAAVSDRLRVAAALDEIRLATRRTFKVGIHVDIGEMSFPTYLPERPTARDFLLDVNLRAALIDLARTPRIFDLDASHTLQSPLSTIASHTDALLATSQEVVVAVHIVFHDGSKIRIRLSVGREAAYVPGSARDGSGHVLPDPNFDTSAYSGRWYYPPGQAADMTAFLEYMRSLGVTIATGGNAGNGVIVCTWNPTTNTTTCYLPR